MNETIIKRSINNTKHSKYKYIYYQNTNTYTHTLQNKLKQPKYKLKHTVQYIYIYIGSPRRNVPDFGRVFLMLKYADITQNTYIQSSMVTEILVREKCGLLWCLRTVLCP
jgi:hypothetical protein